MKLLTNLVVAAIMATTVSGCGTPYKKPEAQRAATTDSDNTTNDTQPQSNVETDTKFEWSSRNEDSTIWTFKDGATGCEYIEVKDGNSGVIVPRYSSANVIKGCRNPL